MRPGHVVALGTGPMVVLATEYLGRKVKDGSLAGVTCLPTCALAASEAAFYGVPVAARPVNAPLRCDVMLEQADAVGDRDGTLPFISVRSEGSLSPQPLCVRAR